MKKFFLLPVFALGSIFVISCSGKKETPASIAEKWCNLNAKAHKAAPGAEKDAAEAAREKFENEIEAKYKGDEAFMKEVEMEVEKCEDASEGR